MYYFGILANSKEKHSHVSIIDLIFYMQNCIFTNVSSVFFRKEMENYIDTMIFYETNSN